MHSNISDKLVSFVTFRDFSTVNSLHFVLSSSTMVPIVPSSTAMSLMRDLQISGKFTWKLKEFRPDVGAARAVGREREEWRVKRIKRD